MQLRDIKPLIEFSDYSLWILLATLVAGFYIGYKLFKKVYKKVQKGCPQDCPKYYFEQLKRVDWSNPKKAAYDATKYGRLLARDKRRKEIFNQLRIRLDRYKYKNDIGDVDRETLNYFNLYLQVCDESF